MLVMNINYFFNTRASGSWVQDWGFLLGVVLGALITFLIDVYKGKVQDKKTRREFIEFQYIEVISHLNAVVEVREALEQFLKKLQHFIEQTDINSDKYDVGVIFMPKMSSRPMSNRITEKTTGSSFLNTYLSQSQHHSRELDIELDDLKQQLEHTCSRNERMSFLKVNSAQAQKKQFMENLSSFNLIIRETILGKNLPIQIKNLLLMEVGLLEINKIGKKKWLKKMNPTKSKDLDLVSKNIKKELKILAQDNIKIFEAEAYFTEEI
jgi:hypothetical protein